MKTYSFTLSSVGDMPAGISAALAASPDWTACSLLVQVYSSDSQASWLHSLAQNVEEAFPSAVVVGATTIGEICAGESLANTTLVVLTWFRTTRLQVMSVESAMGQARACGRSLGQQLQVLPSPAAVLLLATPLSLDAGELFLGLAEYGDHTPVFGGGAGVYSHQEQSAVLASSKIINCGLVAVAFIGDEIALECQTYLGWVPFSREMRITDAEGTTVNTIDGLPAYEVYKRYLNIAADDQFFFNVLEFPLLLEREQGVVARIPVKVTSTGALEFIADVNTGEVVRFGYGHVDVILEQSGKILEQMTAHTAESIFLFSCGCRRFLMQEDVGLETQPFQSIAQTNGFYTYGEFFGTTAKVELLNAAMVAVALKETATKTSIKSSIKCEVPAQIERDPYARKHTRVISRLTHFIAAVTGELVQANADVNRIAITDDLTELPNRRRIQALLNQEIARAERYGSVFSVAMVDIDHFKEVNDAYGHQVGDCVLREMGSTFSTVLRKTDTVGRWGGEEFLMIFPEMDVAEAAKIAEKLRLKVAQQDFSTVGRKTASFGVVGYTKSDTIETILSRADQALYKAKKIGRNCVCVLRSAADLI